MARFMVSITPSSNPERPEVTICPQEDVSGQCGVDRYMTLDQLMAALLSLGVPEQEIEGDVRRKVCSGEVWTRIVDVTEEQAKSFGWEGNP
jgi:hypothetical protein